MLLLNFQFASVTHAYELTDLKADLDFLRNTGKVSAELLFNPFGDNPDSNFVKHRLSDEDIYFLCDGNCQAVNIGVNFATTYKGGNYTRARTNKMNWSLEIVQASTSPNTVIDVINNEQIDNVIVRIGTGAGSGGFDNPTAYINFLRTVANGVNGKTFYAIAGPNEPDIETWATPGCISPNSDDTPVKKSEFYQCVGRPLATYMNAVVSAGLPANVRLLSPAFNLTSFTFNDSTANPGGIPQAMLAAGANFSGLYALAGNIYPSGDTMQNIWQNNVANVVNILGKNVVITETGPWSAISSSAYDLSIYDEYDADPDKFYVHPIKGLEVPYASRSVTTIRNDMINQGYEAHCATPQFKIKLNQEGEEWMETLLADRNEATSNLDVRPEGIVFGGDILYQREGPFGRGHTDLPYRSVLTVDYRDTLMPVFRDVTGKRWLTTSLEEYFGFSDIKIGDRSLAEINSAPINSLLSRTNYCTQAITILTKQEEMCQKIQDGDTNCALYPRLIPDSPRATGGQYTVKTLLEDYKTQYGANGARFGVGTLTYNNPDGIAKFCQGMISNNDLISNFQTAVKNTPLNIDRAYRLGFLVTEIEMIYPSTKNMLSLFEHPNAGFLGGVKNPQDAVLVTAFKIPDFGTNKGGAERLKEPLANSTAGNVFWPDAAWLTRNSLMTKPEQVESEQVAKDKRSTLQTAALQYDTERSGSALEKDEIYCNVGVGTTGVGAPECQDPLSRATIDIINASAQLSQAASSNTPSALELQKQGFDQFQAECPTLDKELSTQISDPATLQPVTDVSKVYTPQFGADLLDKLFEDSSHEIAERGSDKDPSFAETWRDREPFGTLARWYGDEDDPETDNEWGGLRDWGLKSVFHVVNETLATKFPNDCCKDMRKVKHYLVYPVGYDLQTVQTVLAGSFFSTDELISLAEAAEEYDRIQVSGDLVNFEGAKKDVTFQDNSFFSDSTVFNRPNWPLDADVTICDGEGTPALDGCVEVANKLDIVGNCTEVKAIRRLNPGQTPPIVREVTVGWRLPCTRNFGWEVVTDGDTLSAGILGGKLGFYLREIQKALNTKASDARQYLDTCKSTEQFLRGQCGSGEGLVPTPTPDTCTWMGCSWIPAPPPPAPIGPPQAGCAQGQRGREICIRDGKLYIYDHNVDVSGDGTPDEYCGGHVTVDSSNPPGCQLTQQRLWGFSSPGGPLSENLGCNNLTQVTATFDSSGGSCAQQTLSVVAQ